MYMKTLNASVCCSSSSPGAPEIDTATDGLVTSEMLSSLHDFWVPN